jgi:hypothetical protein
MGIVAVRKRADHFDLVGADHPREGLDPPFQGTEKPGKDIGSRSSLECGSIRQPEQLGEHQAGRVGIDHHAHVPTNHAHQFRVDQARNGIPAPGADGIVECTCRERRAVRRHLCPGWRGTDAGNTQYDQWPGQ